MPISVKHLLVDLTVGVLAVSIYFGTTLYSQSLVGSYPDVWVTVWSLDHIAKFPENALYYTDQIFAPEGSFLILHNLCETMGFMASLLGLYAPEHYNKICAIAFLLNFLFCTKLLRSISSVALVIYPLSLFYTFHPYHLSHLDAGHLNLLCTFPILIVWLGMHRDYHPLYSTLIVGSGIVLATFTDWYILYFSLISVILLGLHRILSPHYKIGSIVPLALGTTVGLIAGCYKIFLAFQLSPNYTSHHNPARHSLNLLHFFYPSSYQTLGSFLPAPPKSWNLITEAESGAYLGIVVIGVGLWSALRFKKASYLVFTAFCVGLVALGPTVSIGPLQLSNNPAFLLTHTLPIPLPVPARLFCLVLILMVIMLAQLYERISTKRLGLLLVQVALMIEFWPAPIRSMPIYQDKSLQVLQKHTAELVLDAGTPELATFRTLLHGKPTTSGFLARRPKAGQKAHRKLLRKMRQCEATDVEILILERSQTELEEKLRNCPHYGLLSSSSALTIWHQETQAFLQSSPPGSLVRDAG